ncbi:MAG: PorV/PorQ family protein [Candidatus Kapabacteria bacterium]|nr:PorV/PorQ family protein [Candidatus Kapabacteria bacterium]MDW8225716.1 PorV/PorQ family protein [Bacteroidota bacterium]
MVRAMIVALMLSGAGVAAWAQAGAAAVPFLLISPDARASGMGEAGVAIADNVNAIFWNPGGLGFLTNRQIALSFSRWLPQFNADLFYSYVTAGQYLPQVDGTVAVNFILMNLGEFVRTDNLGNVLGTFRSNEFALGVSYGTLVADDIGAGVQLRFIRSNLAPAAAGESVAGVGTSGGFDLGLLWRPSRLEIAGFDLGRRLSLGLNLQNIGPKMTYRNEADPLPTNLRLGMGIQAVRDEFNDLKLAVDIAKLMVRRDSLGSDALPTSLVTAWRNPGVELAMGMEYWYQQTVALRLGYFTEPSRLGNRRFITFGAGVRYDMFTLDFNYINTIEENHPLAGTMRFSLLIDLGSTAE